jgi:hypothetical protein
VQRAGPRCAISNNGCAYCIHMHATDARQLTLLIGAINVWNRLAVGLRAAHPVDPPDLAV